MKKFGIVSIAVLWSLSSGALAGSLVLTADSGGFLLQNACCVDLTGGNLFTGYDGEIIQLGYFSGALSKDNNFVGRWIPISGEGSANFVSNTPYDTTVGDIPNEGFAPPNNQFMITLIVNTAIQTNLPQPGTILSIRVFDRSSLGTSTAAMTLSSNLWRWRTPTTLLDPDARVNISFADSGLRVENRNGPGGLASTPAGDAAVPVPVAGGYFALRQRSFVLTPPICPGLPEPSCSLLALAGCVALFGRRRN